MNDNAKPMNPMFYNRTISQLLKMFVIPEIDRRITNNTISKDVLPLEIRQFRIIQKQENVGRFTPIIEINEEVNLIVQVKPKIKLSPGVPVLLGDIDPNECYIEPPKYGGVPAGYFYLRSTFLDFIFVFDLNYNVPDELPDKLPTKIHLPLLDIINADNWLKTLKPLEKFRILALNSWPPSPSYFPYLMSIMHSTPDVIKEDSFVEQVANIFNPKRWEDKINFWKETGFFDKRIVYIERAIKAHYEEDYIASTYIIVPQIEGIIVDYLKNNINPVPDNFPDVIKAFKNMCLSRKVLLYPKEVVEVLVDFIDKKAFWKNSSQVHDVTTEINRHGIAHGSFTGFECKEISLKPLILFDGLSYVLLNDRIAAGTL